MRADAELRIADVTLNKNKELCKKNVVSELHCFELEAQKDIAAAAVAEAGVQVRSDEIKIADLKLYAPFAGVISRPMVAEGARLDEQTSMATLSKLDPILIKASVPYQVYTEQLNLWSSEKRFIGAKHWTVLMSPSCYQPARNFLKWKSYRWCIRIGSADAGHGSAGGNS